MTAPAAEPGAPPSPGSAPSPGAAPGARRALAPLLALQSALLAVLASWPTLPRLATAAVGSPDTDTPKHLWTLWWMRRELWDGVPGLSTTWVNFPEGMELFPISPLDGLLTAALPFEPVLASNVLALFHLALLGLCAGWLGEEVVGTRLGAHVAGALAQGAAFTGFALEVGVGELRLAWWIPLGLACLVRARRTGARRWFVALGVALAGATLSCFYHGLFLATATAVWALATLELRAALLRNYALAAALSLVLVLPVVRAFSATYDDDAHALLPGAAVSVEELFLPAADDAARRYEGGRYLGLGALLLGVVGVVAAPRRAAPWVGVLGVTTLLALGPVLTWRGQPVVVAGSGFVLPMAWLNDALGAVGEPLNFPARFLAPGMVALAVLGALATRWRATALLVPLVLVDIAVNDRAAWPRATMTLAPMPGLAEAAGEGAVADLSMVASYAEPAVRTRSIAAQLALGRPFASVPVERLSRWGTSGDRWLRALPLVDLVTTIEHRSPPLDGDWRADLWLLRDRGFDRLLLTHRRDTPDVRAVTLLTRLCGDPVRTANATLWRVPDVAATPAETTAWRAEQDVRVAALAGR